MRSSPSSVAVRLAVALAALGCRGSTDAGTSDPVTLPPPLIDDPVTVVPVPAGPTTPVSKLVMSEPIVCSDPTARDRLGPYRKALRLPEDPQDFAWFWGAGVGVADLDGDGVDDWVFPGQHRTRLYHWDGHAAVDVSAFALPTGVDLSEASAAIPVDIDSDGDLDLYITRYERPNVLLRNDGGRFVDDTAAHNLAGPPTARSVGASFADPDHDGDLDLFVSNYGPIDLTGRSTYDWSPGDANTVMENVGGGVYVDRTDRLVGPASTGFTFLGGWFDFDDDGAWEIYAVNDFGAEWGGNALVHFDDWTFRPDDNALGLDVITHGMGLGIADLNDDGAYDVLVSAWADMHLLISRGALYFDSSAAWGLTDLPYTTSRVAWGNDMADLDNDGLVDLIINFGYVEVQDRWPNPERQPDMVLRQTRSGVIADVAPDWDLDDDFAIRGSLHVDVNGDGYLDVLKASLIEDDAIHLSRCGSDAFLELSVDTPTPNTFGIGTRVKVTDGGRVWMDTIRAGGRSLSSGEPPRVHLGLGDRDVVDTLQVRWPDGTEETWHDVPTRRRLHVSQVIR
ncbi:MAG: CRTAC1 family protein [Alphaproteobacteria bacterium]|nr:CRTAC1 family protein [Alphaproteobacteria bacterium]